MYKGNEEQRAASKRAYNHEWYLKNKERRIENNRKWLAMNPEKKAEQDKRYKAKDPEKARLLRNQRAYRHRHKDLEKSRQYGREYAKKNHDPERRRGQRRAG